MAASIRKPVVVILGATGTGKTKLSLELAKLFKGEIISADSMQVYKGLDIITNKASVEEQQTCPHHLINYLSPYKENNNVIDFRQSAIPIINSILEKSKVPLIVGGTIYYIECLLWKAVVDIQDIETAALQGGEKPEKQSKLEDDSDVPQEDTEASSPTNISTSGTTLSLESQPEVTSPTNISTSGTTLSLESQPEASSPTNISTSGKTLSLESQPEASSPTNISTSGTTLSLESQPEVTRDSLHAQMCVTDSETGIDKDVENVPGSVSHKEQYDTLSNRELHHKLLQVDPITAHRLHPNCRRKIIRALDVYQQHGVSMSDIHRVQKATTGDTAVSGPLLYPHTCIFWLQCDKQVLEARLDKRVDKMLEQGLVQELTAFHHQYNKDRIQEGREPDYERGIFQSIGFKEFHDYLILNEEERSTENGRKLFEKGVENLKTVTRQYSRYQIKRITKRILNRPGSDESRLPVYGLDCTDVDRWDEVVSKPAVSILNAIIKGETPQIEPLVTEDNVCEFEYKECSVCDVVVVTKTEWQKHFMSKRHRLRVKSHKKKLQELSQHLDTYVQQQQQNEESQPHLEPSQQQQQQKNDTENT